MSEFRPSYEWQDVPDDAILPPGLQIKVNLETGRKQARLMPNGNGTGAHASDFDGAYAAPAGTASSGWPEPEPLPQGLPPVEPFPLELLPDVFAPWVADVADRMQVPPDYVAVAAMSALGSVIGRRIGIRPKRHDDWLVVPNVWGAVIGRPGLLKTPAMQEALRPLTTMEREAGAFHDRAMKEWEARQEVEREAKKLRATGIRNELKANRDPSAIARDLADEQDESPEPTRRRFMTNDATVPKLGELLRDNPSGLLVFRDEMIGWLRTMEEEGREADRAFYLEAWNGTGRFTFDRIGRGTVDIEAACVSVLGGIQPGPLLSYLEARAWDGAGDDGLLQRFQLAVWPDAPKCWRNVDRWPNTEARNRAVAVFERMARLTADQAGARDCDSCSGIPALRFDDEAQKAFDHWREKLEGRLRSDDVHPAFEAHLSKYRSLLPSLALICHLADSGRGPVSALAFARAEAWCEFLESHALRLYDALLNADRSAANALGARILKGNLPSPFKLRDVYRPCWAGLASKEAAQEAADVLRELHWLRSEDMVTGGRPITVYYINPSVRSAT
jgi:hypothetical protein